jgi:hypothetical protein
MVMQKWGCLITGLILVGVICVFALVFGIASWLLSVNEDSMSDEFETKNISKEYYRLKDGK